MNVQHQSTSNDVDLDSTAEVPVLDIAAAEERLNNTDTWISPAPTLRVASDTDLPNKEARILAGDARPVAVETRPQPANDSRAHAADARSELETNLRALSANLGDLEDRLKRKVEQLAENERRH